MCAMPCRVTRRPCTHIYHCLRSAHSAQRSMSLLHCTAPPPPWPCWRVLVWIPCLCVLLSAPQWHCQKHSDFCPRPPRIHVIIEGIKGLVALLRYQEISISSRSLEEKSASNWNKLALVVSLPCLHHPPLSLTDCTHTIYFVLPSTIANDIVYRWKTWLHYSPLWMQHCNVVSIS